MSDDFMPLQQAARRVGVSRLTFRRRVHRGDIEVFSNPRDGRSRLVRVADLENFITPKPALPRRATPRRREDAAA